MELLASNKPFQATKHLEMESQSFSFPKVCKADPNTANIAYLQQFMMNNEESIIYDLKMHGAILFRGYDIKSPNQSIAVLKHMNFTDFGCCENKLKIIVGTKEKQLLNTEPLTMFACQSSSDMRHANIHNQFCETSECPQYVALYCFKPAVKGGNISLINWRELSKYVDEKHPDFLQDIKIKGITEINILPQNQNPEHNIRNGWKNSFKVANQQEAQEVFKSLNYEFQWLKNKNNDCILKKTKKGSELYNILNEIISFYKNCEYQKSDLTRYLTFGDGEKIPHNVLDDICQNAQKYVSEIEMRQSGDLMIINYEILKYIHCPFEGPEELRKYYVSFMRHQSKKEKCTQFYQILNNGYKLPMIGFGTWKIKKEQAQEVVYNAIKNGYRLIDCAPVYQNEREVGMGIKKAIKNKVVKREDLFITSKLWNTNHRPEHVRPACESTLKQMSLEYLDLFLMHFPVSLKYRPFDQQKYPEWIYDEKSEKPCMFEEKIPVTETWKAMEDLTDAKLVRNIGLSNFPVSLIRQVINTCQIKPHVLQNEIHPQLSQRNLVRYTRQEGIQVTSYSSFGASSYYEIGFAKKTDDQPSYKNKTIIKIGQKHNKTPHQVILRWVIQRGIAIIPKSVKPERMKENSDLKEFNLDQQDMEQIQKLNKNRRFNDPGQFCQGAFGKFYPLFQ